MPTRRKNGRYYTKRQIPGFGKVRRSLDTERKAVARRREETLLALAEQGRQEVIRAWLDGDVSLVEIVDAHEKGTVHQLARRARHGSATLGEACEAALTDKAPDVADSTLARYRTGLHHLRAFAGDDLPVRDTLTTDHVQSFKAHRLDEDKVARETVNNDLIAVSILVTYALRKGWIEERPEIKKFSSIVRISYIESDEIRAYMAAVRGPFRPLFQLLLGTGMRLGEAEALRVADLRFGNDEARAQIREAKTDEGVRVVFIPPWVRETLEAHLEATGRRGTDRVFQIPRRTVQMEHGRACGLVGIHDYTIHDHRHTAAVHLARAGAPLPLIQQQLGHARIEQTMRYAQFSPDYGDIGKAFNRVADALGVGGVGHSPGHSARPKRVRRREPQSM